MRCAVFLLAASALVHANPQGVTRAISPSASRPSGCTQNFPSSFGIQVIPVHARARRGDAVSQIGDGQVQASHGTGQTVSQIGDGQIQAPTGPVASGPAPKPVVVTQTKTETETVPSNAASIRTSLSTKTVNQTISTTLTKTLFRVSVAMKTQTAFTTTTTTFRKADTTLVHTWRVPVTVLSTVTETARVSGTGSACTYYETTTTTGAPVSFTSDGQIQAPTGTGPITVIVPHVTECSNSPAGPHGAEVSQIPDG